MQTQLFEKFNDILSNVDSNQSANLMLVESYDDEQVDGIHVIGKVRGRFFFPEGTSRNNRFYSKELWEKQLDSERIQELLTSRRMFGTIGHSTELDEQALKRGEFSHIVTSLQIDRKKNEGIGEALILNTPAGRVLKTILGARSQMFVSSRAEGKFLEHDDGVGIIDPDNYILHTFDFVLEPGFLKANPALVESMCEDLNELSRLEIPEKVNENKIDESQINNGGTDMSTEALKALNEANEKHQKEIKELLTTSGQKDEEIKVAKNDIEVLENTVTSLEDEKTNLETEKDEAVKKATEVQEELDALKKTHEEILSKCDNPEDMPKYLEDLLKTLEAYKVLGTPEEIQEYFTKSEELLDKYREQGSPEEIGEALDKFEESITKTSEEKEKKIIEAITSKYSVSEEKVKSLLEKKLTEEEIAELCEDLAKSAKVKKIYGDKDKNKVDESEDEEKNESALSKSFRGTRAQRLMQKQNESYKPKK